MNILPFLILLISLSSAKSSSCQRNRSRNASNWFVLFPQSTLAQPLLQTCLVSPKETHFQRAKNIHLHIHKLWEYTTSLNISFTVNAIYTSLFPGASLQLDVQKDIDLIKQSRFVNDVAIVGMATALAVSKQSLKKENLGGKLASSGHVPNYNVLQTAHDMTGLSKLSSGNLPTGKGIKVGIIDTGIDFNHPALGGGFGKGKRVCEGRSFVSLHPDVPIELHQRLWPFDEEGHGTFIAGIIGGKGEDISGVAPDVQFGAYKVVGCDQGIDVDKIFLAIEQAVNDGMQIISLSLGSISWPESWFLRESSNHMENVIIVVSNGNDGPTVMNLNHFASRKDAVAVSSVDVSSFDLDHFRFNQGSFEFSAPYTLVNVPDKTSDYFIQFPWEALTSSDQGCQQLPLDFLKDKIVLIDTSGCLLKEKIDNLEAANARGIVFFPPNNDEIISDDSCLFSSIPLAKIYHHDAISLIEILQSTNDLSPTRERINNVVGTAGNLSPFNSFGPSIDLRIKPDIVAPGGFVTSTFPLRKGGFGTDSGTSFAAPYVSGVAALYLEKYPGAKYDEFRRALMNNAVPLREKGSTFSVARQGAGLINVPGILNNIVSVIPYKLEFKKMKRVQEVTFEFSNNGRNDKKYQLSHSPSSAYGILNEDHNTPITLNHIIEVALIDSAINIIHVPPKSSTKVRVKITSALPNPDKCFILSGFINFEDISEGSDKYSMHIPYQGMKLGGVASCIRAMNKEPHEIDTSLSTFPKHPFILEKSTSSYWEKAYHKETETIKTSLDPDYPLTLNIPLHFPADEITVDLMDASGQKLTFVKTLFSDSNQVPYQILVFDITSHKDLFPVGIFQLRVSSYSEIIHKDSENWYSPIIEVTTIAESNQEVFPKDPISVEEKPSTPEDSYDYFSRLDFNGLFEEPTRVQDSFKLPLDLTNGDVSFHTGPPTFSEAMTSDSTGELETQIPPLEPLMNTLQASWIPPSKGQSSFEDIAEKETSHNEANAPNSFDFYFSENTDLNPHQEEVSRATFSGEETDQNEDNTPNLFDFPVGESYPKRMKLL